MAQTREVRGVATSVLTIGKCTLVTYRKTAVVTFDEKTIILDSGGWRTNTTKLRMNQAANEFDLHYHVYQENHEWFVVHKGVTIPFEDGMILDR